MSEGGKDFVGERDVDGNAGNILPSAVADWTSEDELDVWEVDETNDPGPVLNKKDETSHSDSDIEIIEPPTFFTPSKPHPSVPPKNTPIRHPPRIPRQLHTPPQSHTSSGSSLTPTRDQSLDKLKNCSPSRTSNGPVTPSLSQPLSSSEPSYLETSTKKAIPKLNLALLSKTPRNHSKELPHPSPAHAWRSASKSKSSLPNPKLKPIVLLTPRRSEKRIPSTPHSIQSHHRALKYETEEQRPSKSSKGKEKASDIQDEEAELSSPSKSSRRRGRPRNLTDIVVDSGSTKLPAKTSPSKRITQDAHPHCAPSNEDSDDPILISPPSHRSSHPSPVEKGGGVSLFSRTSTSSRKTRKSDSLPLDNSVARETKPTSLVESQKFLVSPGLRKRKRTISDLTTELPFERSPEKRTDRKDSPSRHSSNHASSSRFIDGKLTLSSKAIY